MSGDFSVKRRSLLLDLDHVRGLRALVGLDDLKFHRLAFSQRLEPFAADRRKMDEHVARTVVLRNEPVTLLIAEPLHFSFHFTRHLPSLKCPPEQKNRGGSLLDLLPVILESCLRAVCTEPLKLCLDYNRFFRFVNGIPAQESSACAPRRPRRNSPPCRRRSE